MANVLVSYTLPAVSGGQSPIEYVRIDARVDESLPWTEVNRVAPPANSVTLEQVPPGTWFYRGVVVDTQGQESPNPPTASIDIPFTLPSDLTTFTVTLA